MNIMIVSMESILFLFFSTIMANAYKFKSIPEKSLNITQNFSNLVPNHLNTIQVETTNIFGNDFCTGTYQECIESIKIARSNIFETIKKMLYNDLKSSLEKYSVCMYSVLDAMIKRNQPINKILKTITISNSKAYALFQFLFDNGVNINDVLTLYILYSDLDYIFKESHPNNKDISTLRQSIDYITKSNPNTVILSDEDFELKLKELLLIKEQIDSLSLGPLQINDNEKWMTANILKWKKLLLSNTSVSKLIGNEISERNGKSVKEWFHEIKTTTDAREVSFFYTEVSNILVNYVGKKITLELILIKKFLSTLLEDTRKIKEDYKSDILKIKNDQNNLFENEDFNDFIDVVEYQNERITDKDDIIKDINKNYKNKQYNIAYSLNKLQNCIHYFILQVNTFIDTMNSNRRISSAMSLNPLLSDLKLVKSLMKHSYNPISTGEISSILGKLNTLLIETDKENSILNCHSQNDSTILIIEDNAKLIANIIKLI